MKRKYRDVDLMKIRANAQTMSDMGYDMFTLSLFYFEIKDLVKAYSITDDNVQNLLDLGFRLYYDYSTATTCDVANFLSDLVFDLSYELDEDETDINNLIEKLTYERVSNDFVYSL